MSEKFCNFAAEIGILCDMTREVDFNVSARTAKLIGLENFANAEGAIVELIKNAYDADSSSCVVIFDQPEDKSKSCLYIIDNGSGMTDEIIQKHWMTIGTDDKLLNALSQKKSRVKSGAKGIGRFALNRLGRKTDMWTFPENGEGNGFLWSVNWRDLEQANVLSDFHAKLSDFTLDEWRIEAEERGLNAVEAFSQISSDTFHGTILCISELNDDWGTAERNSLQNNLEMLIPEHMESVFSIYLNSIQDLEWGGKINPAAYEDFDYKIVAHYKGGRTIYVEIERNELNVSMLETKYADVFKRKAMKEYPYRLEDMHAGIIHKDLQINSGIADESLALVGSFDFTFFYVKNTLKDDADSNGAQKYPYNGIDAAIRKQWLRKFGGVRIFRDDFRVRPYGENGNDWLGLGRRQAQSPGGVGQKMGGYRIRPNQIAGVVSISRLQNVAFEDKSSREGIQENATFELFKNLLLNIIEVFEEDRNTIMYNLSELYREQHPVMDKADKIAKRETQKSDEKTNDRQETELETLAQGYTNLKNEIRDKDAEIAMLRGLASMGISVATYTHELRSVMERLLSRTETLRTTMHQYLPEDELQDVIKFENPYYQLELMHGEDEKMYNWLRYSLNSIQRSKRDRKDIDLVSYLKGVEVAWKSALNKRHIDINASSVGVKSAVISGLEIDLDSIFNNFVANSVASLINTDVTPKEIAITLKVDHDRAIIDFIDNGHGLADEYRKNPDVIFNAFETSAVDKNGNKIGTGMGLYIVKGIVSSYSDADVSLLSMNQGFGIRVILKLKENK
jgi:signal transduction histidine kinase